MPETVVAPPPISHTSRKEGRMRVRATDEPSPRVPLPPEPTEADLCRQELARVARLAARQEELQRQREARFMLFAALPGGLTSTVIHLLLLISLGVFASQAPSLGAKFISVMVVPTEREDPQETAIEELHVDIAPLPDDALPDDRPEEVFQTPEVLENPDELVRQDLGALLNLLGPATSEPAAVAAAPEPDPATGLVGHRDAGGGLASRRERRKQALAYGATMDSENAVDLALEWLARHQRPDGSWSFDHRQGKHHCADCTCGNPGRGGAENGATGMVLLAFLGAGHTHLHGPYREQIAAGLRFLLSHQKRTGDLMDASGNLYSHGLATLALCEALAMTRYESEELTRAEPRQDQAVDQHELIEALTSGRATDPASSRGGGSHEEAFDLASREARLQAQADVQRLTQTAQRAVEFVQRSQHSAGGWRYSPKQAGDTSVVGWQLMALRSGYLAGLTIDPKVIDRADRFLNSVADDQIGSCYSYIRGQRAAAVPEDAGIGATTPIGLLCRIYTGWSFSAPGMTLGVKRLGRCAERNKGLYFYYYATQVMHHYGGERWQAWNEWMRDYLVKEQSRTGAERGSWFLNGPHDDAGRLYCTAMAAMTLEIYYRYSPVYSDEALAVGGSAAE